MKSNWQWLSMVILAITISLAGVATAQEDQADPESEATTEQVSDGEATIVELTEERSFSQRLDEGWTWIVDKWQMGGMTMYALGFVAIVALLFGIDRLVNLQRQYIAPRGFADHANELWQAGEYEALLELTEENENALGEVIRFLVKHRRADYQALTSSAEDIAMRSFDTHTRRNYPLLAVGTIAPLLGLMGTIFGLMGAFASIGVYGSMDDPSVLAGDIGEAMVTTATGLIIAVPALAMFHYFRSRTSRFASLLGEEVSNLMHEWFLTDRPQPVQSVVPPIPDENDNESYHPGEGV